MKHRFLVVLVAVLTLSGCATGGFKYAGPLRSDTVQPGEVLQSIQIDPELQQKILALDPENISEDDVKNVLSKAPAPHVLSIHGGIYPVHLCMISFAEFLIRMGYPEQAVRQPQNGSFSYSPYFDAKNIAGAVAWHYERDAMRPMLVGHSQGGMQVMKVLHELAGHFSKSVPVWSPLSGKTEKRDAITDPFTGQALPVTRVKASYATAVGAGGLTRMMPNQWVVNLGLRSVPGSTEDFTGFRVDGDFLGGDLFGVSPANLYNPDGQVTVRNVELPFGHDHVTIPNTKHLALNADTRKWLNEYHPVRNPKPPSHLKGPAGNLTWGADVWYSIKKHWCLELQDLVRRKQGTK